MPYLDGWANRGGAQVGAETNVRILNVELRDLPAANTRKAELAALNARLVIAELSTLAAGLDGAELTTLATLDAGLVLAGLDGTNLAGEVAGLLGRLLLTTDQRLHRLGVLLQVLRHLLKLAGILLGMGDKLLDHLLVAALLLRQLIKNRLHLLIQSDLSPV
jgi:hypothetical protein